jgi:carboxylesterase type B
LNLKKHAIFIVSTHGSEYIYLFGHSKDSESLFDEADKAYRDFWIQSIVDFVKSGSPKSARNPQWEQATIFNPHTVLRVDNAGYNLEHSDKELKLWNELNRRCGYNIFRQIPLV